MDYSDYAQQWVKKRSSSKHLAHDYLEKPALWSLVRPMDGVEKVLCLGCGSGEECQVMIDLGADEVIGVDNAKGLIEAARYTFPQCQFVCQDIMKYPIFPNSQDLIFSSLTFHYVKDLGYLLEKCFIGLADHGELLFSMHHPVKWGAQRFRSADKNSFIMGYEKSKNQIKDFQIFGNYLQEYEIKDKLFGTVDVTYYNRSLSEILKLLRLAGFRDIEMIEPTPVASTQKTHPDFYETYSRIPLFVIFKARKL